MVHWSPCRVLKNLLCSLELLEPWRNLWCAACTPGGKYVSTVHRSRRNLFIGDAGGGYGLVCLVATAVFPWSLVGHSVVGRAGAGVDFEGWYRGGG